MSVSFPDLSQFDLTHPEQLVACLWQAHYGDSFDPAVYRRFWERDLAACRQHLPQLLRAEVGWDGANRMRQLIRDVAAGKLANTEMTVADDDDGWDIPRGWFGVFFEMLKRQLITDTAWGFAARLIYMAHGIGPMMDGAHHALVLEGLRAADPAGLMSTEEVEALNALPATVRLYRGSCTETLQEAAQGVSWTGNLQTAVDFARSRVGERRRAGLGTGAPHVVEAHVPRSAVIGILAWENPPEYLVDFEKLDAEAIRSAQASLLKMQVNQMRWTLGSTPLRTGLF